MNITLVTIGSTGDVRPYVILGKELKRRGHTVTIAAFEKFRDMVQAAGLGFFSIAGNAMEFIDNLMKPGTKGIGYLRQVVSSLREILPVMLNSFVESCTGADAMVCTFFGSMYYSVAEKYNIPCIQTEYFPIDSHPLVPMSSAPGQHLGKYWNLLTYRLGHFLISVLEKIYFSRWRKELGVSTGRISTKPDYSINGHIIPVVYAMSPEVFPPSPCWQDNIQLSGFWYDNDPADFVPDTDLKKFISSGEPPVYIGFGSMVSGNMQETFRTVVSAVRQSGIRAVVDGGWAEESLKEESSDRIFILRKFVSHDWLFPQMKAVIHHGGAGTTATGLRYGKPTLIIPFGGDQPFWGNRVYKIGCGPKPLNREKLTEKKLTAAINDLVSNKSYVENGARLAEKISRENGIGKTADIVEKEIEEWGK